jgi:hypothetical protein
MWPFARNKRYAEPIRLKRFLATVNENECTDAKLLESLNKIYVALNDLIQSDVEYYDDQRHKQRRLSTITRGGALFFGTVGVLAPLLQNANPELFKNCAAYGYLSLAVAAAFLMWNRLFGATGGHIRYVMAQFDLGRLMTEFRLDWSHWLAENKGLTPDHNKIDKAFAIFQKVSNKAYQIVQEETKIWGKSMSDALAEYERAIGVNEGSNNKINKARQFQVSNSRPNPSNQRKIP